jgi:hypothetical protein
MMTQDPFQTYQTPYSGGVTPFGLPLTTPFQSSYNPFTGPSALGTQQIGLQSNPMAGSPYGLPYNPIAQWAQNPFATQINPLLAIALQQQHAYGPNPWINPLQAGLHNPALQNPIPHPLAAAGFGQGIGLGAGLHNPMVGHHAWGQPQHSPFGYLPPQTLLGSGIGQGYGPFQPYGAGVNPYAQGPYAQAASRSPIGFGPACF